MFDPKTILFRYIVRVSAESGVNPNTVKRFFAGGNVQVGTEKAICHALHEMNDVDFLNKIMTYRRSLTSSERAE